MVKEEVLERIENKLDRISRLIALQSTATLKQTPAIQLLANAGFDRQTIAELLHTTPNTVSVTLSTSKTSRKSSKKTGGGPR